jgi:hypothetical protein
MEQGAFVDLHGDGGESFGGGGGQQRWQVGIIQPMACDGDGDLRIVIAEAIKRGFQARHILAGAGDDGERACRRAGAQRHQLGAAGDGRVQRAVTGGRDFHGVG